MFSPGPRDTRLFQEWGIDPEDEIILFMGTIYKFSGLDRIIRDFPRLLSRHGRAKLLIVGSGEDEERLKAITFETVMSRNVVFGGLQHYYTLPEFIRSSDVCIIPLVIHDIFM